MKEQNFGKSKQQDPVDLEKRLRAYYGPQLREQPLSQTSWQNLRLRLGSQEDTGRRHHFSWRFPRKRSRAFVPTSIQDAFSCYGLDSKYSVDFVLDAASPFHWISSRHCLMCTGRVVITYASTFNSLSCGYFDSALVGPQSCVYRFACTGGSQLYA